MTEERIYPKLPSVVVQDSGQSFRLREVSEIKRELESERNKRQSLYKKYKKVCNVLDGGIVTVDVAGVASETVAMVAIAGLITAPVGFILGGVGMGCFGIGLVFATIKKKIEPKLKKHDEIRVLVEAKLNTISEFVSKALDDNQISQTEFVLIKSELRKFYEMKNGIKNMGNAKTKSVDVKKIARDRTKKLVRKTYEFRFTRTKQSDISMRDDEPPKYCITEPRGNFLLYEKCVDITNRAS